MKKLPKLPKRAAKKLPKAFQGAVVVRGVGMKTEKLEALEERHALDQFDATQETWLVIENKALESGFSEPKCFTSRTMAIRYARARGNGNVDQRVLRVCGQILVVATENEL